MPRQCSVCAHPGHLAIDAARRSGVSLRELSRRFRVGHTAVFRHAHQIHQMRVFDRAFFEEEDALRRTEDTAQVEIARVRSEGNRLRRMADKAETVVYRAELALIRARARVGFDAAMDLLLVDLKVGGSQTRERLLTRACAPGQLAMREATEAVLDAAIALGRVVEREGCLWLAGRISDQTVSV